MRIDMLPYLSFKLHVQFFHFHNGIFFFSPKEAGTTTNLEKVFLDIDFQLCYNDGMKYLKQLRKREGII